MTAVRFPWNKTLPGQGFFVPCLDIAHMRMLGLRAALHENVEVEATVGVCGGRFGLWFVRVR